MTTTKYDIEETDYGVTGWNGILQAFIQKFETYVHARMMVTLGEDGIVKGNPLYYNRTSGRWEKAQADGAKQPARCIAAESGDIGDEIRAVRIGPITLSQNFEAPYPIWLHPDVAGAMTQDEQTGANAQCLGFAYKSDGSGTHVTNTMHVQINDECDTGPSYSTTTTSTTTSTTTTTSSSTTTTS